MNQPSGRDIQLERIERGLSLGGLVLIAVTWPLWTPQDRFPRIALLESIASLPDSVDASLTWIALGLCCASLLGMSIFAHRKLVARWAAAIVALSFLVLVLLDQHRLQPWCIHISVCLLLATWARPERRLDYLTWFTASIYVYSAIGKFDAQFLHTVGQDFVRSLLGSVGWNSELIDYRLRVWIAFGFPLFELCAGLGLAWRPTRWLAAVAAIGMHIMLLWVLGPLGLDHAWGVLIWNSLFIVLNVMMFLWPGASDHSAAATPAETLEPTSRAAARVGDRRGGLIELLLVCALVVPAGERLGLVDHWLGWALYAPHSSRVHIEIFESAVPRLPAAVQPFVQCGSEPQSLWCVVRVDRWSLATLGAPLTPQQRFQIGVARALLPLVDDHEIRADILSTADRWTGRRKQHELRGSAELNAAAKQYWFNTTPRFDPID